MQTQTQVQLALRVLLLEGYVVEAVVEAVVVVVVEMEVLAAHEVYP